MSGQPNRLPADAAHGFGGIELDRSKPLSFKLNGRKIDGFAGDTILTAVLASGIDSAGSDGEERLALDARFCPPVLPRDARQMSAALPMERTPAIDGLDLATAAPKARTGLFAKRDPHSLGHQFDGRPLELPWLRQPPAETIKADILIVGAGVTGLAAAEAAIGTAKSVVLVERRPWLGGDARYFGPLDSDETPDAFVTRVSAKLTASPRLTLLSRTDVFEINGTTAIAHQVLVDGTRVTTRVVAIEAAHIILATGSVQRLPVFAGNRRPGVITSVAAYHRAKHYGVWRGRHAIIATQSNYGYRLATRINDAGIAIQRIVDNRLNPQSRFIDYSKASGFTLSSSLVPISAAGGQHDLALTIRGEGGAEQTIGMPDGQIVLSGSWQPDLALWMRAGGGIGWNGDLGILQPHGQPDGIALAGGAAGFHTMLGCIGSGRAQVAAALGKPEIAFDDTGIDTRFETPDATTPIAPVHGEGRAYLDGGVSLIARNTRDSQREGGLTDARALSLGDVAASVQLGLIEPIDAGIIADERGASGGDIRDGSWRPAPEPPAPETPVWLAGRFGPDPVLAHIIVDSKRRFEPGALIYANTASPSPGNALGVITGPAPNDGPGGMALLSRQELARVDRFILRTATGPVPVRIAKAKAEPTPPVATADAQPVP